MSKLERYFAKEADMWKARAEQAEHERDELADTAQKSGRVATEALEKLIKVKRERDEAYESAHRIEVAYNEALALLREIAEMATCPICRTKNLTQSFRFHDDDCRLAALLKGGEE